MIARRRKGLRFPNGIPRAPITPAPGDRPPGCCGACPPLARGGYDCTCPGNPRCPNTRRRWLPRRGTWTPLLPLHARLIAAGVIPAVPLFYGIDYLLPGETDALPASYSIVEQQLPIQAWGVLHLIAALTMIAGFAGRWPRIAITGCVMSASVLSTMAVGRMAAIIDKPWWDGISGPAIVAAVATACWAMAAGYALQIKEPPRDDAG